MVKIRLIACVLAVLVCLPTLKAQVSLTENDVKANEFGLVNGKKRACLYIDKSDFEVVRKAANLFSNDVRLVTGKKIQVKNSNEKLSANSVIVGTLGRNKLIDDLVANNKLDVTSLKGRWESYLLEVVQNPFPGVSKALVVVGSDRRGTAYGLFSISEAIGVSPWYWWADAPVAVHKNLNLCVDRVVSEEPSVKYRGIFINDEDWGLLRWAKILLRKSEVV